MPSPPPDGFLNRPLLRQLAGENFFARGEEYFAKGRVRQLHVAGERVTARVNGSRSYRVKLWRGRGELHFSCNCAAGREEAFCKHCVAVGLAFLAGPDGQPASAGAPGGKEGPPRPEDDPAREQVGNHLRTLDKDRLINLVLEATDYDDILRRRLLLETIGVLPAGGGGGHPRRNAPPGPAPDLEAYRQLLREAIETGEYVDYEAMPDYAQGVEEAIYPLGELLRAGHAAAVIDLAEFALVELDRANEMLDGGDGSLNPVYDDLQHYHLEACRAARPDPEKLAVRLLHYELEGGLGVFNNASKAYADVLGPRGLAAWKRRLAREWSSLPPLTAEKTGGAPEPINHRRFQLQALMERLAEVEGDLAARAAVKQRDLSSAHDFLALAELYASAGQDAEALAWAERGLRAFPGLPDQAGLRDFAAGAFHRLGRHEEAVRLAWEEFERFGDVEHFRKLQEHARQGDADGWPPWRARALARLRERSPAPASADRSVLVEILLADGADDEAWAEAVTGGCRADLWLQLAARREKTHPADALRVYQNQLAPTVARGGPHAYQEAAALLGRIEGLFRRLGRADEFPAYRAEVRAAHRHKRHFLRLLDASGG